ncbi:MAG TPA: gamma-glutamyl-gamma-aminobutyrate hydrolase family protein [Candidatus Polarisedimenticolaceae bacterium]
MQHTLRLLVIDPSIVWPEDAGVAEIVADWPGTHRVIRPALEPATALRPGDPYDADAVVVMGSRASVHDPHPWLADLGAWLDPLISGALRRPLLGICFGHQLVAARAGAPVGRLHEDGAEERGVQTTRFSGSRLAPDGPMRIVASHGEVVRSRPRGFRVTASRERVAIDALEHDTLPVFSVQFHPEARAEFLARRGMPPGPQDELAFEEQARFLAAFRRAAIAEKRT